MKRTPRGRPDLRLAESYIPAAFTWVKGMIYTAALCILTRVAHRWWALALPLLSLYYDHLWWSPTFMDSTSVCVDVVMATVVMQTRQVHNKDSTQWCWMVLIGWSIGGCIHIYFGDAKVPHYYHLCSHVMPIASLLTLSFMMHGGPYYGEQQQPEINYNITTATTGRPDPQWLFYCRSAAYLILMIVDAYTLRPPTQRERDRMGLVRYGAVLFCPIFPLCVSFLFLLATQSSRLYHYHSGVIVAVEAPPKHSSVFLPVHKPKNNNNNNNNNNVDDGKVATDTSTITICGGVDSLEVNMLKAPNTSFESL